MPVAAAEFPFVVLSAAGEPMGERRTRADAVALVKRLQATIPWRGPFRIAQTQPPEP